MTALQERDQRHMDQRDSTYDMGRIVWPTIGKSVGVGRFQPVEGTTIQGIQATFDRNAGIDWLQTDARGRVTPWATRVQWACTYRTFTIRLSRGTGGETEFAKRCRDIRDGRGGMRPYYTLQAYVRQRRIGPLLLAGYTLSDDLILYAEAGLRGEAKGVERRWVTQADGTRNEMLFVRWSDYVTAGNFLYEWNTQGEIIHARKISRTPVSTEMLQGWEEFL